MREPFQLVVVPLGPELTGPSWLAPAVFAREARASNILMPIDS